MPESLSDRLKRLASERRVVQDAQEEIRAAQQRADVFISNHARSEFEKLQVALKSLVEEANPTLSDLPKYQTFANGKIQQGNYVAMTHFDKPIADSSENRLIVSFGPHPQGVYFFTEPPASRVMHLYAGCNDSIDAILWMGDLGELSTSQLAETILEGLTRYYLEHAV